ARPRRSRASSLRVWLATSPSRRVAREASSQDCVTAAWTSAGTFPLGYARLTMREKSAARFAHSMTPGDSGGGGGGGGGAFSPAPTSHGVLGSERWIVFRSSWRWW